MTFGHKEQRWLLVGVGIALIFGLHCGPIVLVAEGKPCQKEADCLTGLRCEGQICVSESKEAGDKDASLRS